MILKKISRLLALVLRLVVPDILAETASGILKNCLKTTVSGETLGNYKHQNHGQLPGNLLQDYHIEIYLHSSREVPTTEILVYKYDAITYLNTFEILKPLETITVGNELREFNPEERGCRFPDENILYAHREYSYTACIAECRAAMMMKLCGCIHPMSPKIRNANLCDHAELKCLQAHVIDLMHLRGSDDEPKKCGCLRDCEGVKFQSIHVENYRSSSEGFYKVTLLKPREQNRRRIMQGQIEHFVAVGGIISLFLGASFMSLLELPYFLIIRLIFNFYKSVSKLIEFRRMSKHQSLFRRVNKNLEDENIHLRNMSREDHRRIREDFCNISPSNLL